MAVISQKIPRSRNSALNVLLVSGGAVIGQLAIVAAIPIVTRLYAPHDMGLYATFTALAGMFQTTIAWHYELAIPLPKTDAAARRVCVLALLVALLSAMVIGLLIQLFCASLLPSIGGNELLPLLWLLPVTLALQGLVTVQTSWSIRKASFLRNGMARSAQGVAQSMSQVAAGLVHASTSGLVTGQIVGQVATIAALLPRNMRVGAVTAGATYWLRLWATAKAHWRFPLIATWSSVINALCANLPVIMLVATFGTSVAGQFALSYRVLQIPLRFLGQAISQVFFSQAAAASDRNELQGMVERIFQTIVAFGTPCFAALALLAPTFFKIAFGPAWVEAGLYTQLLTPWMFAGFVSTVLSMLVGVLRVQGREFFFQAGLCAVTFVALAVGMTLSSPTIALTLLGCTSGCVLAGKIVWLLREAGLKYGRIARICVTEGLVALPLVLVLLTVSELIENEILVATAGVLALGMIHVTNLCVRKVYDMQGGARVVARGAQP